MIVLKNYKVFALNCYGILLISQAILEINLFKPLELFVTRSYNFINYKPKPLFFIDDRI